MVSGTVTAERIAVAADLPSLRGQAAELARELALPLVEPTDLRFTYLLIMTPQRLELREQGGTAPGPVYVDFLTGAMAYRRHFGGGRNQPLARAVGLKGAIRPRVLDPTAGLGRDAFVLACLGCRVQLVERSPIVAALLRYGLEQAAADPKIGPLVRERLSLVVADGRQWMGQLSQTQRPEVVYLDPMYPHRTKSALVKKEMRALRRIVGEDEDAPALLAAALGCAQQRVVVKRPSHTLPLEGPRPQIRIESRNTRFDVYLTANHLLS